MEQVVLDSLMWEDIRNYMHKFPVSKETIALDVIEAVGHAGTFLKHPHTVRNFRTELIARNQAKRHLQATLSTAMAKELRETARKTLKEHKVPALQSDIIKRGTELVRAYEKQVAGH